MQDNIKKFSIKDYSTKEQPTWCPWCWDFTILNSLKWALNNLQIVPEKTCLIAWIWCWSLMPYWVKSYWMCTLHGRSIPVAKWVKLANKDLTVIVNAWDWDSLWIWLWHFSHSFRRNLDITLLIDNNWIYWLTKWQTSPTAKKWTFSSSTPFWSIETPVNWLALATLMWATFVARWFTWDQKWLTAIIEEAIKHKWTAVIDILQPCVTFNKVETYEYYFEKVEDIWENLEKNNILNNWKKIIWSREDALKILTTQQEKIPVWIFYREEIPTYEDQCFQMDNESLVKQNIENIDVENIMKKFS